MIKKLTSISIFIPFFMYLFRNWLIADFLYIFENYTTALSYSIIPTSLHEREKRRKRAEYHKTEEKVSGFYAAHFRYKKGGERPGNEVAIIRLKRFSICNVVEI